MSTSKLLALLLLLPTAAIAQDGGVKCRRMPAQSVLQVALETTQTVRELATWMAAINCDELTFTDAIGGRKLLLAIKGEVTVRQASAIFQLELDALGLGLRGKEIVDRKDLPLDGGTVAADPCKPDLMKDLEASVRNFGDGTSNVEAPIL